MNELTKLVMDYNKNMDLHLILNASIERLNISKGIFLFMHERRFIKMLFPTLKFDLLDI